jgi:hypothetical protein
MNDDVRQIFDEQMRGKELLGGGTGVEVDEWRRDRMLICRIGIPIRRGFKQLGRRAYDWRRRRSSLEICQAIQESRKGVFLYGCEG